MNQYVQVIKKNIGPIVKNKLWPITRKFIIFIGIIIILIFGASKVNWQPIENWVIEKLTYSDAKANREQYSFMLQNKVSITDTIDFKKEKLLIFKTNIKNSIELLASTVGVKPKLEAKKPSSVSEEILKNSKFKDLPINNEVIDVKDTKSKLSNWDIVKKNLKEGFGALNDMLSVSIVTQDGKPMMVEIVEDKPVVKEIKEFDSSDKVLRWGHYIQAAADKYGIPPELIAAVIEQESGGNASVESHAGAIGLMQLMPGTAEGLKVNPYDPAQNIDGGAKYLAIQLKRFGSIELALAAYNCGPGNVNNSRYLYISETQNYIRNVPALMNKYRGKF